ncbi:MAG: ABC transporter substrate-binding protein [Actinomycetota bacterium]|nr:ABC transporter substrate-binding protein [Actinomycetota bacterium]
MDRRSLTQLIALLGLMVLALAACGQKPGVSEQTGPLGALADLDGDGIADTGVDADGDGIADLGGNGSSDGTLADGGDSGSTGSSDSGGGGGGGGGPQGSGGGGAAPSGGDTTGVTDNSIKIGLHAPITGAAPVPQASFEKGKDLYFEWLKRNNQSINGRGVTVVSKNDNYNPSQAVAVCQEMVEQDKVFLLFGLAGTDQIQACARYAESVGVPYLSAGVTEIGLTSLRTYFALWMSYKQQGPLIADMVVDKLGGRGKVNGMVRFQTPNFQDAHDSWVSAMGSKGARVTYDRAVPKTAGASDAQTVATELRQRGVDIVYILSSPSWFIQLANAAAQQGYKPQWVGAGITKALDTVANVACKNQGSIDNARFLHPAPAYVDSDKFDPDFRKAGGTDDIMWGLWAGSKATAALLRRPGKDLSRERFVYFSERASSIKTGVLPTLSFSPTDHFGGSQMHLLRAECSDNRFVTEQAFVNNF